MHPNLTLNDALGFVLQKVPPSYQQMLATNYSVGPRLTPSCLRLER